MMIFEISDASRFTTKLNDSMKLYRFHSAFSQSLLPAS